MLSVNRGQRYFVYHSPTDMRNGFDGLSGLVRSRFLQDPLAGDVFIFLNKPRNRIKFLQWQGDGFAIYYKRLEKGTYELPPVEATNKSIEITSQQLLLIMEGISLKSIKKRVRYEHHFVDKKSI
jgi:transposase